MMAMDGAWSLQMQGKQCATELYLVLGAASLQTDVPWPPSGGAVKWQVEEQPYGHHSVSSMEYGRSQTRISSVPGSGFDKW